MGIVLFISNNLSLSYSYSYWNKLIREFSLNCIQYLDSISSHSDITANSCFKDIDIIETSLLNDILVKNTEVLRQYNLDGILLLFEKNTTDHFFTSFESEKIIQMIQIIDRFIDRNHKKNIDVLLDLLLYSKVNNINILIR